MFLDKGYSNNIFKPMRNLVEGYQKKGYSRDWIRRGSIPGPDTSNNAQLLAPTVGKTSLVRKYAYKPVPPRKAAEAITRRLKSINRKRAGLKEFMITKPDGYTGKTIEPADAGAPTIVKIDKRIRKKMRDKAKNKNEQTINEFMFGQGQGVYRTAQAPPPDGVKAFFPRSQTIRYNSLVKKYPDRIISPRTAAREVNRRLKTLDKKQNRRSKND